MSDRVLVMRQGTIAGELTRAEATQERIMTLATGTIPEKRRPKVLTFVEAINGWKGSRA